MTITIPYERIVAALAGPIAILAGYAATWLEAHAGVFATLGIGHDKTAATIVVGVTFVVSSVLTYLGHAKWLSNLVKWWELNAKPSTPAVPALPPAPPPSQ